MADDLQPVANPTKRVTLCAICQYDVSLQQTTYIPEYHLIALRCPECGRQQPAGIIAQPWKYRKLKYTIMSTWWLLLLFIAMGGMIGAYVGMAQSTAYASLTPYAKHISDVYAEETNQSYFKSYNEHQHNPRYSVQIDWWEKIGRKKVRGDFQIIKHVDWIVLTDWFWFLLISPIIGLVFRVLLDRAHPIAQIVFIGIPVVISMISIYLYLATGGLDFSYFSITPIYCAVNSAGQWIMWPTFLVGLITTLVSYFLIDRVWTNAQKNIPSMPMLTRE